MAHKLLYTFSVIDGRILQYKSDSHSQIARLHTFPPTKSKLKNSFINVITFYENLLACNSYTGDIIIVDIYSRKKNIIKSSKLNIETLTFLDKKRLVSTDIDGLVQIHDIETSRVREITTPSIVALLRNKKELNLRRLSCSTLAPLIEDNSIALAFSLIDDNPFLKGTIEHNKLQEMYRVVFEQAVEELRRENTHKAHKLLKNFKDINSKKEEINTLFLDFKHYERFKLHILEKKYSIAYALISQHSLLKHTPEFQEMETIYIEVFKLAREQMLMNKKNLARETLSGYMTILSKREEIKNLLNNNYIYERSAKDKANIYKEELLLAYKKDNFKECYELIDKHAMDGLELITLLEKHWMKLMIKCEDYALNGDIKGIKQALNELISTKTRVDKIGDLMRVAFHSKINILQESKNFNSAQNIIYSYIDIFGIDIELREIMKKFEKRSLKKLAITQKQIFSRDNWLNTELIVEY